MARVLKPNRRKHGDAVFVMRGEFFGTNTGGGGEFAIIAGGKDTTPYLRVEPDKDAGIATVSGARSLRILAHAILKAVKNAR